MKKKIRLHKYIGNCGYCSRRHAELLIEAGLVKVNGQTVSEAGSQIRCDRDKITINEEEILPPEPLTVMLYKPEGFISSTHDTHERLTVMDLLPRQVRRTGVVPVGRLDLDTVGLILLTNNGDLHHKITHPRYSCPKEYFVKIDGQLTKKKRTHLQKGVPLDDGPSQPVRIIEYNSWKKGSSIRIELTEGRKREVKRIFKTLGHTVTYLKRIRIGFLTLGDLQKGKWRQLSEKEIKDLDTVCKG